LLEYRPSLQHRGYMRDTTTSCIIGSSLSFDQGIAIECGVNAAIVYNHILYWLQQNIRNPRCWHEEKIWMYESLPKIAEFFRFLTEKEVRLAITRLLEAGLLIRENFNSNKFDKTSWYSITDPSFILEIKKVNSKRPQGRIDATPEAHPSDPTGGSYKEEIRIRNKKNLKETPISPKGESVSSSLSNFGDHVRLNMLDYDALCAKHTRPAIDDLIEDLNNYIPNKPGKPYKDHLSVIRSWIKKRAKEEKNPQERKVGNEDIAKKLLSSVSKPYGVTVEFFTNKIRIEYPHGAAGGWTEELNFEEKGFKDRLENVLRKRGFGKNV
jgi:hypothetical protein